jgi:hypothetical protein
VPIEDLTRDFSRAERRSAGDSDVAIRLEVAGPESDRRLAIVADAPARITWTRRLPPHAQLTSAVWLESGEGATARIGIADERTYEILGQVALGAAPVPAGARPADPVAPAWRPVTIDLSRYGGWQWSLFYRPAGTMWRLVLSVDASPRGTIAWHAPRLEARR